MGSHLVYDTYEYRLGNTWQGQTGAEAIKLMLNDKADAGWELVSAVPQQGDSILFIFKLLVLDD